VVKGRRHLSAESTEQVIRVFQFTKEEGTFFRNLVHFNKAKTLTETEHFAQQLIKIKKFQNEFPLTKDQFEYYSKWHHIPVRELFTLSEAPQTDDDISRALVPSISRSDVSEAIEKLAALSLIERVDGHWKAKKESVTTGHSFSSFGVVQFHKKMLALAGEALDRFPAMEREISSVTVGMSEATFQKAKVMIQEFRADLMSMAEADAKKERIYQINFQMFPLSLKKEGSTK